MATEIDEIDSVTVISNSIARHASNAIITKETCTSFPHPQPCEPREHAALAATLRGLEARGPAPNGTGEGSRRLFQEEGNAGDFHLLLGLSPQFSIVILLKTQHLQVHADLADWKVHFHKISRGSETVKVGEALLSVVAASSRAGHRSTRPLL